MAIEEGMYKDLDIDEYHSDPAIGSSGMKTFIDINPEKYKLTYLDKNPLAQTDAKCLRFGQRAHIALLEPELFKDKYLVLGDESVTKKTVKAWKEFEAKCLTDNKTPLLYKEYEQLSHMAERIKSHKVACELTTNSVCEASFFAKDSETGLILKARPDILNWKTKDGFVLSDYKTTALPLSDENMRKQVMGLRYYRQSAHHKAVVEQQRGVVINRIIYLFQNTTFPYFVRTFILRPEEIELGDLENAGILRKMLECYRSGEWPSYPEESTEIVPSDYWRPDINLMEVPQCLPI